jgi:hypothetical protein
MVVDLAQICNLVEVASPSDNFPSEDGGNKGKKKECSFQGVWWRSCLMQAAAGDATRSKVVQLDHISTVVMRGILARCCASTLLMLRKHLAH